MELSQKIDRLMSRVQKPSRYLGCEFGSEKKDPKSVDVRYAFLFPDVYEVAMSHLGMKILYHTLNRRADTYCERVCSPWPDMEALMKEEGVPLFSLETRTPVGEFDILGITLQYEMSYTNILAALKLAGIPLYSKDRTGGPFVICGGPCAFNPEPLAPFVDVFTLGDGERAIHQTVDLLKSWRESGKPREDYLRRAATEVEGAYVPSLYDVTYNEDG
ncbi:MAG: B12-binding domain-containing radical SAM protein, partial [Clostridia bacterium]|nr:B12-binding domain-containing radical SAM protein [Clostridia bacterium]